MTEKRVDFAASDRYAARFPDWRPSRARACPRSVAGKRCLVPRRARSPGAPLCVCGSGHAGRVLDHPRMWLTPDRERVLTGEPYGINGETLCRFIADCRKLGLQVQVDAHSPWNPGSTLLVVVRRRAR